MKNIILKISGFLLLSALFISCQKSSVTPSTTSVVYSKVASAVSASTSFNVTMYCTDSLFVGYNKVYFKVTDKSTGQAINQATLVMAPIMDMVTSTHSCPVENPANITNTDGYFGGYINFSMVGTKSWTVGLAVTANGKTEIASLKIANVITTNPIQKMVVIDSVTTNGVLTQTKYPISIVRPKEWKVGMNPFEITINKMVDMMNFPVTSDFTVEITPSMPSMGHGSPNNVNPVYVSNGHYVGSVNFTMTGGWRINMVIKQGTRIVSKYAYFDITF